MKKRPASPAGCASAPAATRARVASPRGASRDVAAASPRQAGPEQRASDVNLDGRERDTPGRSPPPDGDARWSWPPGDAAARGAPALRPAGDTTDDSSDEEERGVSRDVPCCALWATDCAEAGRCVHGARLIRRIHDEDGAAVDVVYTTQRFEAESACGTAPRALLPQPRAVVYKTYDTARNESLEFLVQTEVRGSAQALRFMPSVMRGPDAPLLRPQLALYAEMRGRAHTIPLLDTFRDKRGNPVLVFPFVADDHTPDCPSAVRSYMRQLLESLAFLHDELRVMHRNIKRANCLFSGSGALTLIDFEGACHVTTGALYTRVGNNLYRAPEVAAAKARGSAAAAAYAYNAFDDVLSPCAPYGCLADVFSAGAVFFELLTGARRLLGGDDSLSTQHAALEEALSTQQAKLDADDAAFDPRTPFARRAAMAGGPPALARLTWDAADLLRRMLAGSPSVRCSAAEALEHPYFTRPDADAADDRAFFAAVARERERDHRSGASRAPHPAPRTRRPRRDDDADDAARN